MFSKENVKKMKWISSEYDDFIFQIPYNAKLGDVGFVCDVNDKLITLECVISEMKNEKDMPPKAYDFKERPAYWVERAKISKNNDYSGEFVINQEKYIVGLNVVCSNYELENRDFKN